MDELEQTRKKINEIDHKMATLFEQRMHAVEQVISYKMEHHMEVLDQSRENEVIRQNESYIDEECYRPYYRQFIEAVMSISRTYQKSRIYQDHIAYAGTLGAFSHIAAMKLFPDSVHVHVPTFEDVVEQVEKGEAAFGILPFENSFTGEVGENMDLFLHHDIYIHQMYDLKIEQNLLGIKGANLSDIRQVYSKDQAISQSKKFLEGRGYELIPYPNTALAAEFIAQQQDKTKAAIASRETADLYGLDLLAENINTSSENTTRFIVIGKQMPVQGDRVSLVFTVHHTTGALAKVMSLISDLGYNMESIHSRSLENEPFAYYFYIEIVADINSTSFHSLMEQMAQLCERLKIAGSYKKESRDNS